MTFRWTLLFVCICTVLMAQDAPQELTQGRQWKSDPFRPGVVFLSGDVEEILSIPETDNVQLRGIMKIGDRYRAMIDDKIVVEGEYVGDFVVQKILEQRVLVTSPRGITFRLEFEEE